MNVKGRVSWGQNPNTQPPLGKYLEKQREAVPGPEEGPGSAAEVAFQERAYPAGTISVAQMNNAAAAFETAKGRPFPRGKGRPGTLVAIGPNEALYPGTPLLMAADYVPNRYVAGGRTTSIAISNTCKPGDCRIYVTPTGGGVWRTKNALDGQPHWEYLAGPFGINAAGSVYLDPNDPSDNSVYVGTGEANICGSGCVAGAGIYRSTNGGDTWTKLSGSTFDGLGVGAIVVKQGDPNTIYAGTTTALRGMSSVCCSGITRPVPGAGQWGLYKSTDGGTNWSFIHNGSTDAAACTGDLNEFNNGGVMRSSGELVDRCNWCDDRNLSTNSLNRCRQMLSRIPSKLESLNKGLSTLQFQSLSVSPHNVNVLQGGTQDNGTWQTSCNPNKWENTMIGDGALQSASDRADSLAESSSSLRVPATAYNRSCVSCRSRRASLWQAARRAG